MDISILKPRHSLAHILAQAVQRTIDPAVKLGIGPAIDTGFYYDFIFSDGIEFSENNLKELSKFMQKIIKENQDFMLYESSFEESQDILKLFGQEFKLDLLEKFRQEGKTQVTYYCNSVPRAMADRILAAENPAFKQKYDAINEYFQSKIPALADKYIVFADLCEGPHVDTTKDIPADAFTLDKIAGAYRRGDEKNPMMTRIYGLAFASKQELKEYQDMMEEARKRDHKKLGKELGLFAFSDLVGPGLPMFTPKGTMIRKQLEKFITTQKENLGYTFVHIPHIAKRALYERSGHMGKYDAMMPVMTDKDGDEYVMKAMNCPHHFELFKTQQFSYKDFPVRYAENTTCYRNEKTGELQGLTRVKSLTQDDTHHFVRYDQIQSEIEMIIGLMQEVYRTFGFSKFRVQISIRDMQNKQNYFGDDKLWDEAENILINSVKKRGADYVVEEGEAAFYGPKIDIMVGDSIGRMRQLTTVQLDFIQPENFDMTYIGEDGAKHRPAVLHVAIFGSIERFMGVMIEHFAGAFPLRLAPTQVQIIPVAEVFTDYAQSIRQQLHSQKLRVEIDDSDDSFSKKIRNAELMKIPYIVIVGEKEQTDNSVSVRVFKSKEQFTVSSQEFIQKVIEENDERSL